MVSYLAISLASREAANVLFRWRLHAHLVALCLALIGLLLPSPGDYYCAVLAMVSEVVAWICHHRALERHALGRQAARRGLVEAGLNTVGPAEAHVALEGRLGHKLLRMAAQYSAEKLRTYYSDSGEPAGPARLRELLWESSYFTSELYAAAARRSLIWSVILVAGALLAALLILPIAGVWMRSAPFTAARLILLVIAFLPASDELDNLMLWRAAAEQARELDGRLAHLDPTEPDQLWIAFADYAANTASAPPVPSRQYQRDQELLTQQWRRRKEAMRPFNRSIDETGSSN
jgi:hypothetical protein